MLLQLGAGKDEKEDVTKFGKKIKDPLEDFSHVKAEIIEAGEVSLIRISPVEYKLDVNL